MNTYAGEDSHLQSLMHDVHSFKAVGYFEVSRDPTGMGAGAVGLVDLRAVVHRPKSAGYDQGESDALPKGIESKDQLFRDVILLCLSAPKLGLRKIFISHLRATSFVFSTVRIAPSPSIPSSTGIISLRSSRGTT